MQVVEPAKQFATDNGDVGFGEDAWLELCVGVSVPSKVGKVELKQKGDASVVNEADDNGQVNEMNMP